MALTKDDVMNFDFGRRTDTTVDFATPEDWIFDGLKAYAQMVLMVVPQSFRDKSTEELEAMTLAGLRNAHDKILRIERGAHTHQPIESVTTMQAWVEEAIMDFLYSDVFVLKGEGAAKWSQFSVEIAKAPALARLIGFLEKK